MEQPRILLIGKLGQVGWELRRTLAALGDLTCVDYPEINLADGASIRQWVCDTSPALIVNAAAIDPVHNEDDYRLLLERILNAGAGREYFNPAPSLPA